MKILVVSGFLGAGKTTFIRTLAERTKKDFAVMENEYGAVNVDGDLLEQTNDLNIWELTEGCICCSMQNDFATSILTIANTVDPEYLIVEPTGVGMLSKIIENIQKIEYERITLLEPLTILDGTMYDRCMSEFSEICVSHYTEQGDDWWDSLLTSYLDKEIPMKEERELDLENLGLTEASLQSEQELILFLQGVVSGVFGDICRAKGYLPAGNGWLRFDVTDRTYSVTGIDTMPEAKAIFIGRQLKRNWLREVLQKELYVEVSKRAIRPMRKRSAV